MLYVYEPDTEAGDLVLAEWWLTLRNSGELDSIFAVPPSLGKFFDLFRPPNTLTMSVVDGHIEYAYWFEPVFSAAFFGVWIAPSLRGRKRPIEELVRVLAVAMRDYVALFAITKLEGVKALAIRLGFEVVVEVPGLYHGQTGTILILSKERYLDSFEELSRAEIARRRP